MDPDALQAEVEKWVRDGIITEQQAETILERYETERPGRSRVVIALSAVGSALVFVGLVWFLATSWADLPTAAQVVVLLAAPGLAYLGGAVAARRSLPRAGLALSLLGAVLTGPSLFLLADLAAVDVATVWLLLGWTAVALPTGHALGSRAGTGIGLAVLAGLVLELTDPGDPTAPLSLLGVGLFGSAGFQRDRVGWAYRAVGATFALVGLLALTTREGRFGGFDPGASATLGVLAVGAFAAVGWLGLGRDRAGGRWAATALAAIVAGTGTALAAPETVPNAAAVGIAHLCAVATIAATGYYGYARGARRFVDLAAIAALAQTLSFVATTVVDALSGAIALVVAGTILIVAGVGLERGRRSILARTGD
ncbi:DUF2157 domain protein [Natronomonas moolapensis 8.8.11]|uniref:DUF2157 domain protein n=1 Tax=Natronomonas moolapensis (strain DSM 18674 / CECT 7526 / JCM 14361 / 8.8.11) TaxID=268739 RepID=M1XTC4_NATM8|nr:DUF2157 domain-containing protein [Natronomonas moolapensis]CCQ37691.1 DUF2157 domain protein [Natronomonas moolapensis 8.8.11]